MDATQHRKPTRLEYKLPFTVESYHYIVLATSASSQGAS